MWRLQPVCAHTHLQIAHVNVGVNVSVFACSLKVRDEIVFQPSPLVCKESNIVLKCYECTCVCVCHKGLLAVTVAQPSRDVPIAVIGLEYK